MSGVETGGRCGVICRDTAGSVRATSLALKPPSSLWFSLTWQDDIRETQFPCERQGPVEHRLVLPPDLLQLTSQQLQGNDESWRFFFGGGQRKDISQRVEEEKSGRDGSKEEQYGIMQQGKENANNAKEKDFCEALVM